MPPLAYARGSVALAKSVRPVGAAAVREQFRSSILKTAKLPMAASRAIPARSARCGTGAASPSAPAGCWPESPPPAAPHCALRPRRWPACRRESRRHLHRRKQRIQTLQRRAFHGHAQHGSTVWAAHTPARWAAPPAAAIITSMPAFRQAHIFRRLDRRAVRRKHPAFVRHGEAVSISSAWRMTSQSDLLPMMTATSAPLSAMIYCPCARVYPAFRRTYAAFG